MKIHTLGPETTDSYSAYQYAKIHFPIIKDYQLVLHPSFQDIYSKIARYHGDLFLVPVAYRNSDGTNWTDYNLIYGQQLSIINCFNHPLKQMALVENQSVNNGRAIIHPSTIGILNRELPSVNKDQINFVTSKPLALSTFLQADYQYAIFSYPDFKPYDNDNYRTLKLIVPQMIWCLYQIK
ncbi:hypothetical protein [Lactobacillus sp. Sy-1]|uniref:hypothetical protein n=1 Tax=Lactobacillus sp. Sy-1 TaxID=2109645 RepID=UPI001C5BCA1E|nr:hypothetical protein [Lactobacillus sp. Sy-1]MBW1606199.1 hypothetical protein [Lactobacillus sp. Sy-1]